MHATTNVIKHCQIHISDQTECDFLIFSETCKKHCNILGRNAAAGVIFSPISPGLFLHSLNNWKQLTPDGLHILVKNSCSNPYVKNKVDMTNVCHN